MSHAGDSSPDLYLQPLLEEVLDAAILIQNADFGHVQLYDPATACLEIVAQRGFEPEFLEHFDKCDDETTACGRALVRRARIVIEDVTADPLFTAHVSIALVAGYRSVQSTPMFGRRGQPLGVISTHFRELHRPLDHELRLTDSFARVVAELIERQTADQALRASEIRFRALVQKLPAAVYTCDAAGYITYFNESAADLWGRRPLVNHDRWSGPLRILRADGSVVAPESSQMALALSGQGAPPGEEVIVERPDGTRRTVMPYAEVVRDTSGAVTGGVNILLDITDYKAAQAALRSSESHFRRYFELGLVGMATTSPTKGILEANDELCRILGYERSDLLQKTWSELTHPDDLAADVAQFNRAMAGEIDGYTLDKRWIRKDGRVIQSVVSAKCVRRAARFARMDR